MKLFINQHKYHILTLATLAFVTAVSGYVGFLSPSTLLQASQPPVIQSPHLNTKNNTNILVSVNNPIPTAQTLNNFGPAKPDKKTINTIDKATETKIKEEIFVYTNLYKKDNNQPSNFNIQTSSATFTLNKPNNTASITLKEVEGAVLATLKVYNSVYKLEILTGSSVYDLMKLARDQTDFSFSGKEFSGGLGFFVEEINGQKQNPKEGKYWIYYINGKKAQIGISIYIIQPNDLIEWKL